MIDKHMSWKERHDAVKSALLRTYPYLPSSVKIANWGIIVCPEQNKLWAMIDGCSHEFLIDWIEGVYGEVGKHSHRSQGKI